MRVITVSHDEWFEIFHALREQQASYANTLKVAPDDVYFIDAHAKVSAALLAVQSAVQVPA